MIPNGGKKPMNGGRGEGDLSEYKGRRRKKDLSGFFPPHVRKRQKPLRKDWEP